MKVLSALRNIEPDAVQPASCPASSQDVALLSSLAEFNDRELVATIGWAKAVPGACVGDCAVH